MKKIILICFLLWEPAFASWVDEMQHKPGYPTESGPEVVEPEVSEPVVHEPQESLPEEVVEPHVDYPHEIYPEDQEGDLPDMENPDY